MGEKRKYLLILSALYQSGDHSGEATKEIQIECEPSELANKIKIEKAVYEDWAETNAIEVSVEDDVHMIATVSVKQVLPL